MSAYIYSGLHTGESEAYVDALSQYSEVFLTCPSGDFSHDGYIGESELERLNSIAINPTGSGYAVSSGVTSGIFGTGAGADISGWTLVTITPSLNPDYYLSVVGVGCTRAEAYNDFLLSSGEAEQGTPNCPICLSSGGFVDSGVYTEPDEPFYTLDFKWKIEHIYHEYNQTESVPPDGWCIDGEPDCDSFGCTFAILSGWAVTHSGVESVALVHSTGDGSVGVGYSGQVDGWTEEHSESQTDVRIASAEQEYYLGYENDGEDYWRVDLEFGNMPLIRNNDHFHEGEACVGSIDCALLSTIYYSGDYSNCLEPTHTSVPTGGLVGCYAISHYEEHPSDPYMYLSETWRVRAYDVSISRLGDNLDNPAFNSTDLHHFQTSARFVEPSICDVYKYFHFYDCYHIQSIQSGSALDNCQVLEALEAAPESGHRVKMPAVQWDLTMTGSTWAITGNPNGSGDDCTISSLGSGTSAAYVSLNGSSCGALIQRTNDSGDWGEISFALPVGSWNNMTYIDNQGCSGCYNPAESGNNPSPSLITGCAEYNACVDASGFSAGC